MGFSKRQPDEDAPAEQDPLAAYSAPTVRRPVERGGTQPLDDATAPTGAGISSRTQQRRQRQGGSRVSPQRFGEMARKVDNRQLFLLGGALVLLLLALLAWQASRRGNDVTTLGVQDEATTAEPAGEAAAAPTGELALPPGGAIVTVVPFENVQPTAPPAAAAAGAFVVARTGVEGLFLRAEPNSNAQVLNTLPEGTRVETLGEENNDGTRTWRKVRTERGEGWVAADFLDPAP